MLHCQLYNNFCLDLRVIVVWMNQHELIVVSDVEKLIEGLLLKVYLYSDCVFLDQELWVLVN